MSHQRINSLDQWNLIIANHWSPQAFSPTGRWKRESMKITHGLPTMMKPQSPESLWLPKQNILEGLQISPLKWLSLVQASKHPLPNVKISSSLKSRSVSLSTLPSFLLYSMKNKIEVSKQNTILKQKSIKKISFLFSVLLIFKMKIQMNLTGDQNIASMLSCFSPDLSLVFPFHPDKPFLWATIVLSTNSIYTSHWQKFFENHFTVINWFFV